MQDYFKSSVVVCQKTTSAYCSEYCSIFGWVLNGPLGRKESKAPTASYFIDTSAKLSKQIEDFCNLEFNDSSYEPQACMSQND